MLDQGATTRSVAGQSKFSQSSVARHAQHRHAKAQVGTHLAQLNNVTRTPEETRKLFGSTPVAQLRNRLVQLAAQSGKVAEVAVLTNDARLLLASVRAETDALHRLADRFPTSPEEMLGEGRDAALAVVGKVLRQQLADDEVFSRIAGEINIELVKQGIE